MKYRKRAAVSFLVSFMILVIPAYIAYSETAPLTLEKSIETAKKGSPQIASAKKKLVAAEARKGQAFSGYLPQLTVEGAYGESYQQPLTYIIEGIPVSVGPNEVAEANNWRLQWSQALFTGGKLSNSLAIAELGYMAVVADLRNVLNNLKFDVTSAYQGVIYAKRSIILAMDALSLANDHKREAETMLNVGVVTKADTLRSEVAVADAEYKLTIAKNALIQAENAFNSLLGRDLNEEVILSDEDFRLDEIQPPSYEELLKIAYGNRSDWLSFGYGKESSDKTVGVAMSDFWPSFAMVGTYGYDYTRFPEEGTTNDIKSWTAMLSGTWKLFDGLGTPQKAKEALANKESLLEDEKSLVKAIEMEVKDAVLSMNAALDSLRCSKKALDLAEENHRVARLRYTSGVGTNIEVIDAETALSGSKLNRLKAEFDYEQAKAKINKVVGKDIFKISKRELSSVGIALNGLVKFIELEGGFVGFIDDKGNKYNIFGDKVSEISREIGKSKDGRKVQIVGQPKKEVATIQMWGTPFEVKSFRWL